MPLSKRRPAALGVAALLLTASSATEPIEKDVVVIGAGAAGLAAAQGLHSAGVDFVVLEADVRLGGRVKTTSWAGLTIEKGANWIHGPYTEERENNPLWDSKQKYDLKGSFTNYSDFKMLTRQGDPVKERISRRWQKRAGIVVEGCIRKSAQMWKDAEANGYEPLEKKDISIRQCFDDLGYDSKATTPLKKDVAETFVWEKIDFEVTQRPKKVSNMWAWPMNGDYVAKDYYITDPRGFGYILEQTAAKFKTSIQFGQLVTRVAYSSSGVRVETKQGLTVKAKYAISTLPLGVMQAGTVEWDPPFRQEKISAINGMHMGYYGKVYLKFPRNFWGQEEHLVVTGEPVGWATWAVNLDHPKFFPGSNVLNFHFAGEFAKLVETQPAAKTQSSIMEGLRKLFPDCPDPLDIYVSRWAEDPLTMGSYSDWPLGYTEDEWYLMRRAEGNLWFAGEHLDSDFYGYVHGAMFTGWRAARKVLTRLRKASKAPAGTEPAEPARGAIEAFAKHGGLARASVPHVAAGAAAASLAALAALAAAVSVRRALRLPAAASEAGSAFLPLAEMEAVAEAGEAQVEHA